MILSLKMLPNIIFIIFPTFILMIYIEFHIYDIYIYITYIITRVNQIGMKNNLLVTCARI